MLLADNHFTPVLGIDIHFTITPPWNPFQPYIGFVLATMDYIPFIGATVHINGLKRGVSDTQGIIIPLVHIPIIGTFAYRSINRLAKKIVGNKKSLIKTTLKKHIIRLWVHPYQ